MNTIDIDRTWALCEQNNRKAQQELYDYLSKKMFAVCLRYAKNHAEAEDILQTGFIKLYTKLDLYKGKGSLEGWTRRIMIHTAIEFHRRNKINFEEQSLLHNESIGSNDRTDDQTHYNDLLRLVQSLPIGYRTVFNLYAIEGYSHKEIAEMLKISEGNSKSQLSRARNWLKIRLESMKIERHEK